MNGHLLCGLLNDLKRRPLDAAKELNISLEELNKIMNGKEEISTAFLKIFCETYPVNPRDLALIYDDCPQNALFFPVSESVKSSRIMDRAGSAYYEYRDTASSRCSSFRPEWIKELCQVENNDPLNSKVQWNNGHFMHQFTYFIGPVNFYYINEKGEKTVAVMNTGDSMYISPFVPHTFTTRKSEGGEGLILAITFGNLLAGDARFELAALGQKCSRELILNTESPAKMYASLLNYYLSSTSMSVKNLCEFSKLSPEQIKKHINAETLPSLLEISSVAHALKVNLRDLLPFDHIEKKVLVQNYKENRRWKSENAGYDFVELTCTSNMPQTKSFEVTSLGNLDEFLETPMHQYLYYLGDKSCVFKWSNSESSICNETVNQGDSVYLKPFTKYAFSQGSKFLIVRISGRIAPDAIKELSMIGKENLKRVILEKEKWFDEKGK